MNYTPLLTRAGYCPGVIKILVVPLGTEYL